ncbi:MAG: GNAT family N-acetyltransferase [Desertimonas sp.]
MGEPILPIRTARTTVRLMTPDDAETVTAYRNDPAVAALQDWELPVSLDRVREQIARLEPDDDLGAGRRFNLATDVGGTLVGDVTSWGEGPGSPGPFFEGVGFVPTGEIDDGETVARLAL